MGSETAEIFGGGWCSSSCDKGNTESTSSLKKLHFDINVSLIKLKVFLSSSMKVLKIS